MFLAMAGILLSLCWSAFAAYVPDEVANHRPAWLERPAPERAIPPITQFFPLGVYGGSYGEQTWNFVLDDLREHHMNCWWMNGGGLSVDELDRLLTLGEKAGVRIYWADGGHPFYFPWHVGTAESRKQRHENEIVPLFREWAARFRDRWGLLAWGLCEEMPPSAVEELADYVALVRQEDPNHPPLMLFNNTASAEKAVELYKLPVVSTDIYPLGRDPRCAPDNVPDAQSLYRRFCKHYYAVARSGDAALWVIAQGMGSNQVWIDGPPWFGWMGGYYLPTPAFCAWQTWAAIQEGATGVFFYHYYGYYDKPSLKWNNQAWEYTLRTETWRETCQLQAIGQCFAEVEKVAPFLLGARRNEGVAQIASSERDVQLEGFQPRRGPNTVQLVVAVNNSVVNRREFQLMHGYGADMRIVDLGPGEDVTEQSEKGKLALDAGMGRVFAIGTADAVAAFRQACGLTGGE